MSNRAKLCIFGIFGALALLTVLAPRLTADGFIIPKSRPGEVIPPLTVKYHHVTVEITNQVAKTCVDQVFINNFARDIEGTYIFPVPENAAVSEFAIWIGNERVKGEILDSAQARRIYEDIVRRMKDPGLLEYMGRNLFQARVYPIPANGEKRVQISYTEVLDSENGLVKYLYPLDTEKFSRDPLKEVSVSVGIESPAPIVNVYSPSHRISVRRQGEKKASVGYEESNIKPDKDFLLYYSLSQDDIGLSFMNWENADGGYFMFLASPRYAIDEDKVMAKNLVLVLDSSGSMKGVKIRQVMAAARFILRHLGKDDMFSIVDFDDGTNLFSPNLLPATKENVAKSITFIDGITDLGGTNINDALVKGLSLTTGGERPSYVLFLTDGLPTVGTTGTVEILKNLDRADISRARIFVFGVGDDVNTELLDRISSDHKGTSIYVGENENIEAAVSSTYEKIASPVLSNLALNLKGIETSAVYPRVLPDLFKGSQLVLVGKYSGGGPVTAVLSGKVGDVEKKFVLETRPLVKDASFNFLPRLWAIRRVGYLLEEIRLHDANSELVDEVRRLGLKYGIVTPFTSFLATERGNRPSSSRNPFQFLVPLSAPPEARDSAAAQPVSGPGAVKAAKATQALKAEELASPVSSSEILYKEDKTFHLKDGVWVDSSYHDGASVKTVKFGSDDYFRLIVDRPGIAKYLSAGRNMIITFEGLNYRIVE